MGQPFAQLHILGASTQGQEVASHVQGGILLLKEVLGGIGIVCGKIIDGQTI